MTRNTLSGAMPGISRDATDAMHYAMCCFASLVRVSPGSLAFPIDARCRALYSDLYGPALTMPSDWPGDMVNLYLATRRPDYAIAMRPDPAVEARRDPLTGALGSSSPVRLPATARTAPLATSARRDPLMAPDVQVRQLAGSAAIALADELGLDHRRDSGNPGIHGMRAKNALLAFLRRGGNLPPA